MMRTPLLLPVVLSTLLTACATVQEASPSKHVSQSGTLKVHPGLLGLPVPPELQDGRGPTLAATLPASAPKQELVMDQVGLRTKRSVYFDFDSTQVKEEFDPALQAHARYLAANSSAQVRVEGNADERGPQGYNQNLGMKRADQVRQRLIGLGAPAKQVNVRTLGELKPKLKGHDEESWAENRRADIVYVRGD